MGLAAKSGMRKSLLLFLMFSATACGGMLGSEVTGQSSNPGTYRISDSGVRCVTAPCPSLLATPVGSEKGVRISEIHFPASMQEPDRRGVISRAATSEGLVARGTVHGAEDTGVFELEAIIE